MKTESLALTAGQSIEKYIAGELFYLLDTTSAVDIVFYKNGAELFTDTGMEAGFYTLPKKTFDKFTITSAAAQTIKFAVGDGQGGYNRSMGSVQIIGNQGVFTQTAKSVTNAAQVAAAANTARKSLEVQNNSAAGVLRVRVDGAAASATSGLRLQPGQSYVPQGYVPTGEISVCMETADATANNVEVVEG